MAVWDWIDGAAQAARQKPLAFYGIVPRLLANERMSEHGGLRPSLPPVVTMNWCATCATPLPADWTVCPGCVLYGDVMDILGEADDARGASWRLAHAGGLSALEEAGLALHMSLREAASEFRLRREVVGRSMSDLQARVHAAARNRRRNRGSDTGLSVSVRVGANSQAASATGAPTAMPHPPLPSGWAMVWCPEGRPYYWNYSQGSAQWDPPGEALGSQRPAHVAQASDEGASSGSGRDAPSLARLDLTSGQSARPPLRIRFASARGMTQVAQAFPATWEPEPTPRGEG